MTAASRGPLWAALWLLYASSTALAAKVPKNQGTTTDSSGKVIYDPGNGDAVSSVVSATGAMPTLVYNCAQMPLICSNVGQSSYAAQLAANGQITFHQDTAPSNTEGRRTQACGRFKHDECPNASVGGKKVESLLKTPKGSISASNLAIIMKGPNPGMPKKRGQPGGPPITTNCQSIQPNRQPIQAAPGRFIDDDRAWTCDEFPPASFIEGGKGASTVCAVSAYIYIYIYMIYLAYG